MAEINAKREIVIVTDSCSDMYTELREKYNVEYIPMHIMYKGKEVPASLNWGEVFTQRELWDEIATKNRLTTSQINQSEFVEHFTKWLDEGKDIIYIACSFRSPSTSCALFFSAFSICTFSREGSRGTSSQLSGSKNLLHRRTQCM